MSSDIYLYVEQKRGRTWEAITAPLELREDLDVWFDPEWYTIRSYQFFAALAGVRNRWGVNQPYPLRGLPEDLSKVVQDERDGGVAHSWLTIDEVEKLPSLIDRDSLDPAYELEYSLEDSYFYKVTLPLIKKVVGKSKARIVFWFDGW